MATKEMLWGRSKSGLNDDNNSAESVRSFVESKGDYTEDAALLEDPSKPLYEYQASLPRLPVESL